MKKRILAITATALALSMLPATAAFADSEAHWGQVGTDWFYYLEDGTVAKNTWITSIGGTFWVNNDGTMAANQWVYSDDAWYYVDAEGHVMTSQMLKLNSDLYCLDENGKMVVSDWHQDENGKYYYLGEDGKAFKGGWKQIDGDYYYFLKSGVMAVDALVPGGERVGVDGKWIQK